MTYSHLYFIHDAGDVIKAKDGGADPLPGPSQVMPFDELGQELQDLAVLRIAAEVPQELRPASGHDFLVLAEVHGEMQVVAESVEEGLGAELRQRALRMQEVGAAMLDLRPMVGQTLHQRSSVWGAAEGLLVGIQDADVAAIALQGVEDAEPRWRGDPEKAEGMG